MSVQSAVAQNSTNTSEGTFYYTTDESGCTITGYAGPGGALHIPAQMGADGPVVSIGASAFAYHTEVTAVNIPDSVTNIGSAAFESCFYLTKVVLGNHLENIGDSAFSFCSSLQNAVISSGNIGQAAFDGCSGLTNVVLGDGVTSLGGSAFADCQSLTSITIPDGITNIASYAFWDCFNLSNVVMGSGLGSIGEDAFRSCSNLTSVIFPDSVASIGDAAFVDCTRLTNFQFQGNAPSLGGYDVFYDVNAAAVVYYLPGTTGWGATYGGLPATLVNTSPGIQPDTVGIPLWTNRYGVTTDNGPLDNQAMDITMATNGNVWVTGYSDDLQGFEECVTVVYSDSGTPLRTNHYCPTGGYALGSAIAAGPNGNVYVAATTYNSAGTSDFATIAYSGAGFPLWTNLFDGTANSNDVPNCIAVGADGNIYVAGYSDNIHYFYGFPLNTSRDYATVAYSSSGVPLWTNYYDGEYGYDDEARAIAVGSNGNVYVTGETYGVGASSGEGTKDYATVAYSSTGIPLWTNVYKGPGDGSDIPSAIAVGTNGNVYVAGTAMLRNDSTPYFTSLRYGYATIAYSSSGIPLWTNYYHSDLSGYDDGIAGLAVSSKGNIYVTGTSLSYTQIGYVYEYDIVTIAYSSTGTPLWTNRYDGPLRRDDYATAIASDDMGNTYISGLSTDPTGESYLVIAYSANGTKLWSGRYATESTEDTLTGMALDKDHNVYITGSSWTDYDHFEYMTVKYTGPTASAAILPIPLNWKAQGKTLVLIWADTAFSLQSAPALDGVYTNIPNATSPYTNLFTGSQQFFRLFHE